MDQRLRSSQLVPKGFVVDQMTRSVGRVQISVRSAQPTALCPSCRTISRRVHSRYLHQPSDLPLAGHKVSLLVTERCFQCDAVLCGRQVSTAAQNWSKWR
jgi:transposase